jgi:hypothetical protein
MVRVKHESHHIVHFGNDGATASLLVRVTGIVKGGGGGGGGDGGDGYCGMTTDTLAFAVSYFADIVALLCKSRIKVDSSIVSASLPKSKMASKSSGSCKTLTAAAQIFEIASPL